MKIFWKILAIILITIIGAGVTCGGNIFIASSRILGSFFQNINDAIGLGNQEYIGPNILWLLWFVEIVVILALSIWFFFWRYDRLGSTGKKVVVSLLGVSIFLIFAVPFIGSFFM